MVDKFVFIQLIENAGCRFLGYHKENGCLAHEYLGVNQNKVIIDVTDDEYTTITACHYLGQLGLGFLIGRIPGT